MNCQEALNLLYDIIDNEASENDDLRVRDHLKSCRDCSGIYRLEQAVDKLLRARLENPRTNPNLVSLKAKVLSQLDEVDCE